MHVGGQETACPKIPLDAPLSNSEQSEATQHRIASLSNQSHKSKAGKIQGTRVDGRGLVAPQDFLQGLVYFDSAVVANESPLPESVHEQIDSRACGADHFR